MSQDFRDVCFAAISFLIGYAPNKGDEYVAQWLEQDEQKKLAKSLSVWIRDAHDKIYFKNNQRRFDVIWEILTLAHQKMPKKTEPSRVFSEMMSWINNADAGFQRELIRIRCPYGVIDCYGIIAAFSATRESNLTLWRTYFWEEAVHYGREIEDNIPNDENVSDVLNELHRWQYALCRKVLDQKKPLIDYQIAIQSGFPPYILLQILINSHEEKLKQHQFIPNFHEMLTLLSEHIRSASITPSFSDRIFLVAMHQILFGQFVLSPANEAQAAWLKHLLSFNHHASEILSGLMLEEIRHADTGPWVLSFEAMPILLKVVNTEWSKLSPDMLMHLICILGREKVSERSKIHEMRAFYKKLMGEEGFAFWTYALKNSSMSEAKLEHQAVLLDYFRELMKAKLHMTSQYEIFQRAVTRDSPLHLGHPARTLLGCLGLYPEWMQSGVIKLETLARLTELATLTHALRRVDSCEKKEDPVSKVITVTYRPNIVLPVERQQKERQLQDLVSSLRASSPLT
jgi:hypothetical protein